MVKMNDSSITCPLCRKGHWNAHADGEYKFSHGRKSYVVKDQLYALCDYCETRGYLPGQRDLNKKAIREFQSKLLDYISPSDVLAVREKYCLTQIEAAKIFGGGKQGFSKWERGTATPSGTTARMLKLALEVPQAMKYLAAQANVELTHEKIKVQSSGAKIVAIYEVINRDTVDISESEQISSCENSYEEVLLYK